MTEPLRSGLFAHERAPLLPPDPGKRSDFWSLPSFTGRFAEISGGAAGALLTVVFRLVIEAQRRGEPTAWVGRRTCPFFPPDAAEAGVDLAALPVIWAPGAIEAARVADLLIRSGGFGLVVADLGLQSRLPLAAQTRLASLARKHEVALVCLTEKGADRPSIGSLVSIRAHATRVGRDDGNYRCEARALKDKRFGPGWKHAEVFRGPDGLR